MLKDYNYRDIIHISNEDLLTYECDVLVSAALENQINEEIVSKLKCKFVVEGANCPTTEPRDEILEKKGITLIQDIFVSILF